MTELDAQQAFGDGADAFEYYRGTRDTDGLDVAIRLIDYSVDRTGDADPVLPYRLSLLRIAREARYAEFGDRADQDAAIEAARRAASLTTADHPDRGSILTALGRALAERFAERGEDPRDLDDAVGAAEAALTAHARDRNTLAWRANNVAMARTARYDYSRQPNDLDRAIEALRASVEFAETGDPDRIRFLRFLADCYKRRFAQSEQAADIEAAADALAEAVGAAARGHPSYAACLSSLGETLREKFWYTESRVDLDAAVRETARAVEVASPLDPSLGGWLFNQHLAVLTRFEIYREPTDVDDAIELARRSVAATRRDDPDRAKRLAFLAHALDMRYRSSGDAADFADAVEATQQAIASGRPEDEELSGLLTQLPSRGQPPDDEESEHPAYREYLALIALCDDVDDGVVPLAQACELAERRAAAGEFSFTTLAIMSSPQLADLISREFFEPGAWQAARTWEHAQIVVAAARAAHHAADDSQRWASSNTLILADVRLVTIATARLGESGDIRMLTAALGGAQEGLDLSAAINEPALRGGLLRDRAIMLLACFARQPSAAGGDPLRDWIAGAFASDPDPDLFMAMADIEHGPAARPGLRWPEPLESVERAATDLREAVGLLESQQRGKTLKALADALVWRERLGGAPAGEELIEVCMRALEELPPEQHLARVAVRRHLAWQTQRLSADTASIRVDALRAAEDRSDMRALIAWLEHDWDAAAAKAVEAWDAVSLAAIELESSDPVKGMRILSLHRRLPELWSAESRRAGHYVRTLILVALCGGYPGLAREYASADAFEAVARRILAEAGAFVVDSPNGPSAEQLAGGLTHVVVISAALDLDQVGLDAYALLTRLAPGLLREHREAFGFFAGQLMLGRGLALESDANPGLAVLLFLGAAEMAGRVGAGGEMARGVQLATRLLHDERTPLRAELTDYCLKLALPAETAAPRSAPAQLQRLFRQVLERLLSSDPATGSEQFFSLLQAAKARRTAAMLVDASSRAPDRRLRQLLEQEARLVAGLPDDEPLLHHSARELFDGIERVLMAYTSEYETSSNATAYGALANLRRAIERSLVHSTFPEPDLVSTSATLADIEQSLGQHTAMLVLYQTSWQGKATSFSMLISRTGHAISIMSDDGPFVDLPMITRIDGGRYRLHSPLHGFDVAHVRGCVQDEPAPRAVTREAEDNLEQLAEWTLHPVSENRELLLAAGVDRLIIVPHSTFHFAPLHLAGPPGRPLADDFVITYLACPDQLLAHHHADEPSAHQAAVFALSYRDQPRLPYLETSAEEGRLVGEILRVEPMYDDEATHTAVLDALQRCRWVHLRAHGMIDADAPMFQTIFLSPDDESDGRLLAHEIAALDLSGLELVTLGACESSLGRVDLSDNLRGMPAAFLIAGAHAVIGTLWEVSDVASTTFFTALYRSLEGGADTVGSFGIAQRHTRRAHPEYRDWGAFYLNGGYVVGDGRS